MDGNPTLADVMGARRDVTSQWGENGLIDFICERIGCEARTCIEFGAWDGVHLSNVYPLWHDQGFRALLIEGEPERVPALRDNTRGFAVDVVSAMVAEHGDDSLASLAARADFPARWDVLSVDVDGNDYAIVESIDLAAHGVGLVLVEYNSSIPPHFEYVRRGPNYTGSSALAFVNMMKRKDYALVCCTRTNLLFVSAANFERHFGYDNSLDKLFDHSNISYLMSDYAGNLFCDRLPDHTARETGPRSWPRRVATQLKRPRARPDSLNGPIDVRTVQVRTMKPE